MRSWNRGLSAVRSETLAVMPTVGQGVEAAGPPADHVHVNRAFHDHECAYYDERFAIVHDARSARRATAEVEGLLGRPLRPGERVLDVGCGTGWYAGGLRRARPDLRVVGADLSTGMLGQAKAAGAWPLLQADVSRLPLPDGCLDVVVARGVLHHLPDLVAALTEWRRVLASGGSVVITSEPTPAVERHGEWLVRGLLAVLHRPLTPVEDFWEVASMAANLHVFTLDQLTAAAEDAGFGPVVLRTAGFAATLLLTASYVMHGRRQRLASLLPWRGAETLGRTFDSVVTDRLLPSGLRHTIAGVLVKG